MNKINIKKPKNNSGFGKIFNWILALILGFLWVSVILIHGTFGAISWGMLKLIFAPVGVILSIICLITLIISIRRQKNVFQRVISLVLSLALAFPILMLMNIIPLAYPVKIEDMSPSVTICSPFQDKVIVGWGGDSVKDNAPHVIWASERWAYDLVMEPADVGSDKLEDYGIYDEEVYAPVAGVVVAVYDQEKDIIPNTEEFLSIEGNYVYIKITETQTFLLLNHLKENSVVVKVGDKLAVGDYIGKIGNSGSTSEPHLHIHHQRQDPTKTVHPIFAEGLPLYFYDVNGGSIMPTAGKMLENTNHSSE